MQGKNTADVLLKKRYEVCAFLFFHTIKRLTQKNEEEFALHDYNQEDLFSRGIVAFYYKTSQYVAFSSVKYIIFKNILSQQYI